MALDAKRITSYSNSADGFMLFANDLDLPGATGRVRFGDAMADFQRDTFNALAPSLAALATGRRPPITRAWIERTKGASKDSDLAVMLLWVLAFARTPISAQVGAGDLSQCVELRKALNDIVRANALLDACVDVTLLKVACERTGSAVEFLTADGATAHGSRPHLLIVNELSHINKQDFAETCMDNAAKMPNGMVLIATNAGAIGSWQWTWRSMAKDETDRWYFQSIDRPAPWLDERAVAEARRRSTASRFNRLFYGVWSDGMGDAIPQEDIRAATTMRGPILFGSQGDAFGFGLDLGTKRDASALVVLAANRRERRVKLAWCEKWQAAPGGTVDIEQIRALILACRERYGALTGYYDPWQCEYLAQTLRGDGLEMFEVPFTGQNLNRMATALLSAFRDRQIDLYDDGVLIPELGRLSIEEKSYGMRLTAQRDKSGHCDAATALAVVLPSALEQCQLVYEESFERVVGHIG